MNKQIYNLLEDKGYKFKRHPDKNAAKFKSFVDAFNAAMDIENSFIKASAGQDNKWLYFGEQEKLPEDPEIGKWIEVEETNENEDLNEDDGNVDFDSIIFSLSFGLGTFKLASKRKFSKNKAIFKGDPKTIVDFFYNKFSKHSDKVIVIEKKNKVIFKRP